MEIIDVVVYLNLLGYFTTGSCEGHLNHADPYGYIQFGTPARVREDANPKSIYWDVFNTARNETFRWEKEMFPFYDGTIKTFTPEIEKFFDVTFEEEVRKHPYYSKYVRIEKEMAEEVPKEKERITLLLDEFVKEFPEAVDRICTSDSFAFANIYFTSKENLKKEFQEKQKISMKTESDKTVELFKRFLKSRYYD